MRTKYGLEKFILNTLKKQTPFRSKKQDSFFFHKMIRRWYRLGDTPAPVSACGLALLHLFFCFWLILTYSFPPPPQFKMAADTYKKHLFFMKTLQNGIKYVFERKFLSKYYVFQKDSGSMSDQKSRLLFWSDLFKN